MMQIASQNQPKLYSYSKPKPKSLEPREHVRNRPSIYLGGTDKAALHQMVWEVLDDAISEFENTVYNEITISLLPDKTIRIADDGLGFPVGYSKSGESLIEAYMTKISRGGRAWVRQSEFFGLEGLAGIGISTINALSSFCELEVKRDGYLWRQSYVEGRACSALERLSALAQEEGTGTSITFRPDFSIMEENDFDFELIAERCRELAYLLPQLRFNVQDLRGSTQTVTCHYPQGLVA